MRSSLKILKYQLLPVLPEDVVEEPRVGAEDRGLVHVGVAAVAAGLEGQLGGDVGELLALERSR